MKWSEARLCKARLHHVSQPLADIPAKVREVCGEAFAGLSGKRIAIAVGSRGITGIDGIVRALVEALREAGAEPFIVPAMGSHGGATAEGQARVLHDYGIHQEAIGAPVLSSMEVVSLGTTGGEPDIPVWLDRQAASADAILAVNRVKAHTDFHGPHESGIVKMLTIGLGKHAQALAVHRYGADGLRDHIPRVAKKVLASGKILGALAILEDGYDQTSDLAFASGDAIFSLDQRFLARSMRMMARLPFAGVDALIVDEMGKNYSGTGMDTNVIGRLCIRGQADGAPACRRIAVLDLSPESHGNALGVGLADVTTRRLADKINWQFTYENVVTSGFLERGFLPVVAKDDREAVSIAVRTSGEHTPQAVRIARIRNTLHLDELYLTPALVQALKDSGARYELLTDYAPIAFDSGGTIAPF